MSRERDQDHSMDTGYWLLASRYFSAPKGVFQSMSPRESPFITFPRSAIAMSTTSMSAHLPRLHLKATCMPKTSRINTFSHKSFSDTVQVNNHSPSLLRHTQTTPLQRAPSTSPSPVVPRFAVLSSSFRPSLGRSRSGANSSVAGSSGLEISMVDTSAVE